jgi:hypothetical protein
LSGKRYLHEEKDFIFGKGLSSNPALKEEGMLPQEQQQAYTDFYESARKNDILNPKTTFLIHLASAMAVGCYP